MSQLSEKTFIIGIGAQKAGTSWLHRYLAQREDVYMSPIKELHYFDSLYRGDFREFFGKRAADRLENRLRKSKTIDRTLDARGQALLENLAMYYDPEAYRRFFEKRVPDDVAHFGEITPSYALIPAEGFRNMKHQFPKVKVIYLLRDPIDRHYSSLRMSERKGTIPSAHDRFLPSLEDAQFLERGMYHETLKKLQAALSPEDYLVLFYEELFGDSAIRRLCEFLELPFEPGAYDVAVNRNPPSRKGLSHEQIEAAAAVYRPVYEFCGEAFGEALPTAWKLQGNEGS